MKKLFLALSVTIGMVANTQAEDTTTLFGAIAYQTELHKQSGQKISENTWDLKKRSGSIGIKGTEDLSNGLQAFYLFEFPIDMDKGQGINRTDKAYVGLKGNFGTFTFGRQDNLYKKGATYNDIFQANFFNDISYYGKMIGGGNINQLSYVSPNYKGFQFGIGGVLDGSHHNDFSEHSNSKSFTAGQAAIWYNQNGYYAALSYSHLDSSMNVVKPMIEDGRGSLEYGKGTTDVFAGALGYKNDQFRVGFVAQNAASLGQKYNISGQYYLGQHTFTAAFGLGNSKDVNPDGNAYIYGLEYKYNFSKRTFAWINGSYKDWNSDKRNNKYIIKTGIRHNF